MSYRFALICVYNQYFELIRIKSNWELLNLILVCLCSFKKCSEIF
jgi:hypothetical protein